MVYTTPLHRTPVWAAATLAALGTYPSQGQVLNPGLDFFAFDTFQNFVIFDDSTVTGILSSFS